LGAGAEALSRGERTTKKGRHEREEEKGGEEDTRRESEFNAELSTERGMERALNHL